MSSRRKPGRAAVAGAILAIAAGVAWRAYRSAAGEPTSRLAERWNAGLRVVDREGRELRELPSEAGLRGRPLRLEEMGDRLVLATLASEDRGFYDHSGLDPKAIVRAVGQNIAHGRLVSGASTITQQLVKLLDNAGQQAPRTLGVKVEEAARAENLEQVMSKRDILEAYLNRLPYGHGLVGPEAAAQGYFGVSARDLSWAEAATLAVLPRAPSYLDLYAHAERVLSRQRALLDALRDEGVLQDADHARARAELVAPRPLSHPFLAPHLVAALAAKGELEQKDAPVRASVDLELQRDVEGLVRTHLGAIASAGASDAAALVIDNATGEVLAYVGSASYDDAAIHGQIDMVRARRQPGSTLKPFVYGLAFERGRSGADLLADVPTSFAERGGAYAPGNFDGGFLGPVSAREALAGSLNVPAIRLAAELPAGALLERLHALGFGSLGEDAGHYGLSLALGSGEVEPSEVAGAYVALARGGDRVPLRLRTDGDARAAVGERVMDAGVAASLAEILSDPLARVRGLHGRGPFELDFPVAVKTGTSSGFRDAWTAGFTHERTVVVWIGNADGSATRGLTGASGAGPLFADAMRRAMRDVDRRAPLWDAALLEPAEVCPLSGKLAGPECSEHATRRFVRGHAPTESCELHRRASRSPTPAPGEPAVRCDPTGSLRIVVLPEAFDGWLARRRTGAPGEDAFGLPWYPRDRVPGCAASGGEELSLRVDSPAEGSVFALVDRASAREQGVEVRASSVGAGSIGDVEVVVDGRVAARVSSPYRAVIPLERGDHELTVRPVDASARVEVGRRRFSVR